nr:ATP dependent RNA helicase DDX27 [Hymenolepis microstoma]
MVEFNPSFCFDAGYTESTFPEFSNITFDKNVSTYNVDTLIEQYRSANANDLSDLIVEEHGTEKIVKIEGNQSTDSVREKSKRKPTKRREAEKEDEQFNFSQSVAKYTALDSFISFKLSKPLLKGLTEMKVFTPTPIQCACIPLGLLNRDICACARTGSGKTLAFLLPILERLVFAPLAARKSTKALIISPTRELAVQIFKVAEQLAKHCSRLKIQLAAGGLDLSSQEASLRTNPDIVVATPGRLIDHLSNVPNFSLSGIEYLVLDEADKLLDEYFTEQIKEIIRHCSTRRQTMLFSATMTETVRELATVSLKDPVKIFLNQSTAVATHLDQEFVRIRAHREVDREAILAALLVRSFRRRTIVFLPTKKDCHRMHILLGLIGIKCAELHGDMNQSQRLEALRRFTDADTLHTGQMLAAQAASTDSPPPVDVLLATDLASRGLDIPGVLTVINYKLPKDIKSYVHRVGRTARASNSGRAVSLAGEEDRKLLKDIVKDAPCPVKTRVIPADVISKFQTLIDKVKPHVEEILTAEIEERELNAAQKQLEKAENLAKNKSTNQEVVYRPQRTNWFSEKRETEKAAKRKMKTAKKNQPKEKKQRRK